jgi:hypothetical protein
MGPGWYRDPEDASRYRWWSGTGWTALLSDSPDASLPAIALPEVPPRDTPLWPRIAVGAAAVILVAGLGVVGALTRPPVTAITVSPGPAPTLTGAAYPVLTLDRGTGVVALDSGLTMDAPRGPWKVSDGFCSELDGLLSASCIFGDTSYPARGEELPPVLIVGVVDPEFRNLAEGTDLATLMLKDFARRAHGGAPATLAADDPQDTTGTYGDRRSARITGSSTYETGRTTTYGIDVIELHVDGWAALILMEDPAMSQTARDEARTAIESLSLG